jgi:hypothetical protein
MKGRMRQIRKRRDNPRRIDVPISEREREREREKQNKLKHGGWYGLWGDSRIGMNNYLEEEENW